MQTAFLGLGSNLGDRLANLEQVISFLNENPQTKVIKVSNWLENPAIDKAGPDDFLNGVLKIETELKPSELLKLINSIEKQIDPDRPDRGRKLARKIDIDILLYENIEVIEEGLAIPHPRMWDRDFVVQPLLEIAPELIIKHPAYN